MLWGGNERQLLIEDTDLPNHGSGSQCVEQGFGNEIS